MKPLLATRNSVTMTNFRAHLDMRRHTSWAHKISPENIYPKTCSAGFPGEQSASFQLSTMNSFQRVLKCEAARANTMTGGLDLSFRFPRNGKIPYPHQATWSQPINMRPVRNKGKAEKPRNAQVWKKPAKVCTNKIALQTCNQSA